jgi:hypothetical protein
VLGDFIYFLPKETKSMWFILSPYQYLLAKALFLTTKTLVLDFLSLEKIQIFSFINSLEVFFLIGTTDRVSILRYLLFCILLHVQHFISTLRFYKTIQRPFGISSEI